MTASLRTGSQRAATVFIAVLALIASILTSTASAALIAPIHKASAGFNDVRALTNPTAGQLTSISPGGTQTDGKLIVTLRDGTTGEVNFGSLQVEPNGQFTGTANILVRDNGGNIVDTHGPLNVRGSIRFTEIWSRIYDTNDATLALDGKLTRRILHNLVLVGSGNGGVFVLTARMSETVNDRFTPATTFMGRLIVVAGRRGSGRADVVVTGLRDGEASFAIETNGFGPTVGTILWRGTAQMTTVFRINSTINTSVLLLTQWYNDRVNRAGTYLFLYQNGYGPFGRYRHILIQSGRLLSRENVEGQQLLNGDFSGLRQDLRDTSFVSVAPGGITVITSRRTENLLYV